MLHPLLLAGWIALAGQAAPQTPPSATLSPEPSAPSPTATTNASDGSVILFLIDNSASLPPLDPQEKRVAALEKMFTFLQGQRYRLILFGGRHEIFVDDVSKYRNNGQWTDFYFAFLEAQKLMGTYPPGTEFRLILLTDAVVDPGPGDWADMSVPEGADLKAYVVGRTLALIRELKQPLYVILVGEPPVEGQSRGDAEQTPMLIWNMVQAANGAQASTAAQTLSSFFGDNGLLLKKFVFRVAPSEGLQKVEPVVRRIVSTPAAAVELQIIGGLILPLLLMLFLLLGILVRSFPGPGDLEIAELNTGIPAHLAPDKLRKLSAGGWAAKGLSLVADARSAAASLVFQVGTLDLSGAGTDSSDADPFTLKYLPLDLDELGRALERAADEGTKEEKIFALNLDYMGKNFDLAQAERLLSAGPGERRRVSALDFLRAKVHLLSNSALHKKLTEARVQVNTYGKDAERKDLAPGSRLRIGPYGFVVKDIVRGGRKDARVVLSYERVPSLFGLKTILPSWFQRIFRLRRRSERYVN
jgi:hypothetical protein